MKCTREQPSCTFGQMELRQGAHPVGNSDAIADDELSSSSSPLPDLSPPKNNVEAEVRKIHSQRSNRSLVACIAEYEEKSVESDDSRCKPPKMCPHGTGA